MDANRQVFPIHLCGKCNMEWKFNLAVTITSYLSLVVRQQIVGTRTEQVHTDLLVSWMHMLPQTKNFTDRQHQDGSLHRKQAIRLAYGLSRTSSAWLEQRQHRPQATWLYLVVTIGHFMGWWQLESQTVRSIIPTTVSKKTRCVCSRKTNPSSVLLSSLVLRSETRNQFFWFSPHCVVVWRIENNTDAEFFLVLSDESLSGSKYACIVGMQALTQSMEKESGRVLCLSLSLLGLMERDHSRFAT